MGDQHGIALPGSPHLQDLAKAHREVLYRPAGLHFADRVVDETVEPPFRETYVERWLHHFARHPAADDDMREAELLDDIVPLAQHARLEQQP